MSETFEYPSHAYHCDPCSFTQIKDVSGQISSEAEEVLTTREEETVQDYVEQPYDSEVDLAITEGIIGRHHPIAQHKRAAVDCARIVMADGCPFFYGRANRFKRLDNGSEKAH